MKSIYRIVNNKNNKSYIGLTIQGVRTRFLHHLYEMRSGSDFPIHNAIRKYGEYSFTVETIFESEDCTDYLLKDLEKHYIRLYASNNRDKGYNLTEGGDGTLGRPHSEETKKLLSEKAFERNPVSEETKSRQRESHLKRKESKEWKEWFEKYCNGNVKPIEVSLEKDGELFKFKSKYAASKFLGVSKTIISKLINNSDYDFNGYKSSR